MVVNRLIDTSDELLISRFQRGVQIVRPDQVDKPCIFSVQNNLGSIKKMPFNVYVLDTNSRAQMINEPTVETMGLVSLSDVIGKTVRDILPRKNAEQMLSTDRMVIKTAQTKMVDDLVIRKDGIKHQFFTVKTPLYDAHQKVVGLLGCSILLNDQQPLAVAIAQIAQLGLLQPQHTICDDSFSVKLKAQNIHISQREIQVLFYLSRGKSARETGEIIHLSQRTVEFYLDALKLKLNCNKKSDLIEKILKYV